jgi:mycothiol synthase
MGSSSGPVEPWGSLELRPVETEAELEAYVRIWNTITPDEPTTPRLQRERRDRDPRRLYLLASLDGEPVASGFAGGSDSPGRGAIAPRVLQDARRRGVGSAVLRRLAQHLAEVYEPATVSAMVDGDDEGSLAFAACFGFEEVDRQVEQVLEVDGPLPAGEPPPGVRFVTVAERPELLREAYPLAVEGYADFATWVPVTISLDEWLREEATLPEGSFVALDADGEIVGYSGLCSHLSDAGVAIDGLTVVARAWRRRGLGIALKRAELAWAAANSVQKVVTWTQRGNDGMRAVNERLGYRYGPVTVTVARSLPLPDAA